MKTLSQTEIKCVAGGSPQMIYHLSHSDMIEFQGISTAEIYNDRGVLYVLCDTETDMKLLNASDSMKCSLTDHSSILRLWSNDEAYGAYGALAID